MSNSVGQQLPPYYTWDVKRRQNLGIRQKDVIRHRKDLI